MEIHPDNVDNANSESEKDCPLCPRCLTPFDPLQHYCENCGEAVGQLTPYIPFVNVRFNYSIFDRMWKAIWFDKDTPFIKRLFYLLLIITCVPIMLVGVPFALWRKIHSTSTVE